MLARFPAYTTGESLTGECVFSVISGDQANRYPAASVDVTTSGDTLTGEFQARFPQGDLAGSWKLPFETA